MNKLQLFKFKDDYNGSLLKFSNYHKILYTQGNRKIFVFTKDLITYERQSVSDNVYDLSPLPYNKCCVVKAMVSKKEDTLETKVKCVINKDHFEEFIKFDNRYSYFIRKLENQYGTFNRITHFEYFNGDTHAKVSMVFQK